MKLRIGLENNDEGRSVAWALEFPGCFAYGADGQAAMEAMPAAAMSYKTWIEQHGADWITESDFILELEDTWEIYDVNEGFERVPSGYSVNAWFQHDWKPLTQEEVDRGLLLLAWSRQELMDVIQGLSKDVLAREYPGERWNIAGIIRHIANAEWWYQDRLGLAFPFDQLHEDPYQRITQARASLEKNLPTLLGSRQVVGIDSEFWSPRKVLRRAVWHERDHSEHIRKLLRLT